jgi:hypothetical protein
MPRTSAVGRRGEGPLRVAVAPAARKPHEAIGTYEFSRMWLMDFLACKLALALWSVYILTTMVVPSSSGRHFFSASNTLSNSNSVHVYLVWVTLQTFEAYPTACCSAAPRSLAEGVSSPLRASALFPERSRYAIGP